MLFAVLSKWLFRTHVQCPVLYFFPARKKKYPKYANNFPLARYPKICFFFSLRNVWTSDTIWEVIMMERRKSKEKYQEMRLQWKESDHFIVSWIFWSTACSVELWRRSRDSGCNLSFIHLCRWNWNRLFWATGRRKCDSWSENGRRVKKRSQQELKAEGK